MINKKLVFIAVIAFSTSTLLWSDQKNSHDEESHRPWGYYTVLSDEHTHKVKRLVVYPGHRLSLQRHQHRTEHWVIVSGTALVTVGDKTYSVSAGETVTIPQKALHRIANQGKENVVFIEVQTGTYFGEDDIERLEDDYGRA